MLYIVVFLNLIGTIFLFNYNKKLKKRFFYAISFFISNILVYLYCDKNILYFIINCLSMIFIFYFIENKSVKKLAYILLFFSISFYLEIFIFNFKHLSTLFFNDEYLNVTNFNGLRKEDDYYVVTDENGVNLTFSNVSSEIKSLNIKIKTSNNKPIFATVSLANISFPAIVPIISRSIDYNNIRSTYFVLRSANGISKMQIYLEKLKKNEKIYIENISINCKIPIIFSFVRFIVVFLFFSVLYMIRPSSSIRKIGMCDNFKFKKVILFLILVVLSSIFVISTEIFKQSKEIQDLTLYNDLTDALLKGNFYIEEKPTDELMSLKNPYSNQERHLGEGVFYLWDGAYYKGHYYVYFGIVPVLIAYLPFYFIFNFHLSNWLYVLSMTILSSGAIMYFWKKILQKYYPNISFLSYIEIVLFTILSSYIFEICTTPTLYIAPIITALFFCFLGLGLWTSFAIKESKIKLFLGSFCLALVAGCRPQLIFSVLIGLLILKDCIFKSRTLFSKKGIFNTILFVIPFLIVAIFLMYYNYDRFGSIFDFGTRYNLSTIDLYYHKFGLEDIFMGIYFFLFLPIQFQFKFPFIIKNAIKYDYSGDMLIEDMSGGLFSINHLLLLSVLIFILKKYFKNKDVYYIGCLSTIIGFFIIAIDSCKGGIVDRYLIDFSWLFVIPTIFVLLENKERIKKISWLRNVLLVMIIIIFSRHFLLMFKMLSDDTIIYNRVAYLVEFWM